MHQFKGVSFLGGVLLALMAIPAFAQNNPLPYDRSNHVWYDNDFANDYIDWYLMAVASAGELVLRGMTTSSTQMAWYDEWKDEYGGK